MIDPGPCPCGKPAVTRDGRNLCLKCLRDAIREETPMVGCYRGLGRSSDHRQAADNGGSPAGENAVRAMEDIDP